MLEVSSSITLSAFIVGSLTEGLALRDAFSAIDPRDSLLTGRELMKGDGWLVILREAALAPVLVERKERLKLREALSRADLRGEL